MGLPRFGCNWTEVVLRDENSSVLVYATFNLKRKAAHGPPRLADARDPAGATWSRDGIILFTPRAGGPLFRVSASEGPATPLFELDKSRQEISHGWPHFLPDGRHFLYGVMSVDARRNGVYLASLDGKEPRLLIGEAERAVYSASGHLLFPTWWNAGGAAVRRHEHADYRRSVPHSGSRRRSDSDSHDSLFCFTERGPGVCQNATAHCTGCPPQATASQNCCFRPCFRTTSSVCRQTSAG